MENQFLYLDIPEQLLTDLDNMFPEKCPTIEESERDIFFYAGKRALINWLKERREMQETKDV